MKQGFLSISNSNFAGYTGSKNLVQTKQKSQFIKLDFPNSIFQNPSADRYREQMVGTNTGPEIPLLASPLFLQSQPFLFFITSIDFLFHSRNSGENKQLSRNVLDIRTLIYCGTIRMLYHLLNIASGSEANITTPCEM